MISETYARQYCSGDITKIQNYEEAINDTETLWQCHHILEREYTKKQLIMLGKYYYVSPDELMFIKPKEHYKLHVELRKAKRPRRRKRNRRKINKTGFPNYSPICHSGFRFGRISSLTDDNDEIVSDYCEFYPEEVSCP